MKKIDRSTSLGELAVIVSAALEEHGITATLSGGGAVSIYTDNLYESCDLDFISRSSIESITEAVRPLGFCKVDGAREFRHPDTDYYIEFPPGPLAFGETVVPDANTNVVDTRFGPIRIVTPTESVMDRLSAFIHWSDRQSFNQAALIGKCHELDWVALGVWAETEGADPAVVERLRSRILGK